MSRTLWPVAALLLGAALLFLAGGINGLVLPLRGTAEGFGAFWLGLLGTGWAIGYVSGCLRVPALVARVGHVRSFGVMSSIATLAVLGSLLVVSAPVWVLLRACAGFAFAGAAMIIESWLVERSDADQRGRVFGIYTMVILGASTVGQLSLAVGDVNGALYFVLAAMLYSLALVPTAVSSSSAPQPLLQAKLDIRGVWRNSPLAMIGAVAIGLSNGTFGALAAVYGGRLALPVSTITLFVSMPILAGALAQVPIGALSDRFDRRRVLAVVVLLALAMEALFVTMPPAGAALAIGMAGVLGVALYTMYPILVAHANDHAPPGSSVSTSGALLLVFGLGSMVGPGLAGALMSSLGPEGLFLTMLLAHALLFGYTLWRMSRREAVAADDKERFTALAPDGTATPQTAPFRTAEDEELVEEGVDPAAAETDRPATDLLGAAPTEPATTVSDRADAEEHARTASEPPESDENRARASRPGRPPAGEGR